MFVVGFGRTYFFVAQNRLDRFQDGSEPVPVSFRYTVAPLASMKTFVFKPSQPDGGSESVRAASLGCHFAGNYQKVIRNKTASLIWEVLRCLKLLDNKPKLQVFEKIIARLHWTAAGGLRDVAGQSPDFEAQDLPFVWLGHPCQVRSAAEQWHLTMTVM